MESFGVAYVILIVVILIFTPLDFSQICKAKHINAESLSALILFGFHISLKILSNALLATKQSLQFTPIRNAN